jgi:hypothetical protein
MRQHAFTCQCTDFLAIIRATAAWDPRHQNVAGKMAANHAASANGFASAALPCAAIEHGNAQSVPALG